VKTVQPRPCELIRPFAWAPAQRWGRVGRRILPRRHRQCGPGGWRQRISVRILASHLV